MNGALTDGEFSANWEKLLVTANKLIETELKLPKSVTRVSG